MSVIQTGAPDLATLKEQYRQLTTPPEAGVPEQPVASTPVDAHVKDDPSLLDRMRHVSRAVDEAISAHPKLAVAGAVVAGGLLASRKSPVAIASDIGKRILCTLGMGGAGFVGIHAALAHLPEVVPQVANALAMSPGLVEGGIIASVVALAAYVGNSLGKGKGVEKAAEAATGPKAGMMETLRKGALAISGTVAGGLLATGLVALTGLTAPVVLAAAAAIGAFGGTMMGPVADEGHIQKRWLYAASFAVLPAAISLGHTLGGMDPNDVGAGWGTFWGICLGGGGTAIATAVTACNAK